MGKPIILTEEQEKQIIYNYTILKYGQKKSGNFIPVSDLIVKRTLLKYNIPIKTIQETNVNKYGINHDYFKIQSEDVGYWLGILGSDGCISRNENQIYIELQKSDKELLEKLNFTIKNERPIKDYTTSKGYNNSKLYFYSKEIKKDLSNFRIVPNKTYSEDYGFPTELSTKYYPDYIRGLFDGDGSIKDGNSVTWQIDSGSEEIIIKIQEYFLKHGISLKYTICPKKNMNIYRIYSYGKDKLYKIYELLYGTKSNLFLKRKKEKIEYFLKK